MEKDRSLHLLLSGAILGFGCATHRGYNKIRAMQPMGQRMHSAMGDTNHKHVKLASWCCSDPIHPCFPHRHASTRLQMHTLAYAPSKYSCIMQNYKIGCPFYFL